MRRLLLIYFFFKAFSCLQASCRTEGRFFQTIEGVCTDNQTGSSFSQGSGKPISKSEAVQYCRFLTEGGFRDWELPSEMELRLLTSRRKEAKEILGLGIYRWYWTYEGERAAEGRVVLPATGEAMDVPLETSKALVVCRRKTFGCGKDAETLKTFDRGCLETETGAMWSRVSARSDYRHRDAFTYCKNLREGGYADWLAPSPLNLQRLARSQPTGLNGFRPDAFFWSYDTVTWASEPSGKGVFLPSGQVEIRLASLGGSVVCVRAKTYFRSIDKF